MEVTVVNKTKNELEFEIHGASETLLGPLMNHTLANSNVEYALSQGKSTFIQSFIIKKYAPILFEFYFDEKNFNKINKLSNSLFSRGIDNLRKRDLQDLKTYLSLDQIKVLKLLIWDNLIENMIL